jgi:hypothetical protein
MSPMGWEALGQWGEDAARIEPLYCDREQRTVHSLPPLRGRGREGGKPSGTVRDNTLTPDLESELRTPQGGGEKDAAKRQGLSPGPFDRQLGGDRFLAFDIAFRNCLIATGSFCLVQRAIATLDHGLGGFGHPELRNPD